MMNPEMLEQIAKMLRAQLKGAGHLWWIGGYVYGKTGNDDPFVILYPADEKLQEKVVRVYPHDFKKLPAFIRPAQGGDTEANPNKQQAKKKGIYHECPPFEIVTFDGKETQMGRERRFGDVLRLSRKATEAARGVGAQTPAAAPAQPVPAARPAATPSPPDEPPAEGETMGLPDYRALALRAETPREFDYAAFMTLRNGLYTEQERIAATREMLVPAWKPGTVSNGAMLRALEVYRDKRAQAEGRGEAAREAHQFAKREAMNVYNKLIGEQS